MKKYDLFIHFGDGETLRLASGICQLDACRASEALNNEYEKMNADCVCTFAPSSPEK